MHDLLTLVRKGLAQPERVPQYLSQHAPSKVGEARQEGYRRWRSIQRQKPRIQEFVAQDEFALIILDACRYDAFEAISDGYLRGDLSEVWSAGHWTGEYVHNTWDGFHDLTYVNPSPVISQFYTEERGRADWTDPETYFGDVIPAWDTHWDRDLKTTPADVITDLALGAIADMDRTRLVAHYLQPHFPYIGEYRLPELVRDDEVPFRERVDQDGETVTNHWREKAKAGEVSQHEIRRAYASNLIYALKEVQRLVRALDCPVVVTADHGEHLGEGGRWSHQASSRWTRVVPWLEVESVGGEGGNPFETIEHTRRDERPTADADVEQRLADLGYAE
ncbi:sulfatase-like hydrolase/transferase [Saliphagus sp. LR7]|uniref:sulfatase-like hydrolase/transferase n=1 Tax=Saliphagus sp. LR7 TaxID=2282654 RepID=UPI000DF83A56|nr:sulfatase-like hydrolase/transferase [Saliphagus sp. LR7]